MKKIIMILITFMLAISIASISSIAVKIDPQTQVNWSRTINDNVYVNGDVIIYKSLNLSEVVNGSLVPSTGSTYTLGSAIITWLNAFVDNVYATLVNATTYTGQDINVSGYVSGDIIYQAGNQVFDTSDNGTIHASKLTTSENITFTSNNTVSISEPPNIAKTVYTSTICLVPICNHNITYNGTHIVIE